MRSSVKLIEFYLSFSSRSVDNAHKQVGVVIPSMIFLAFRPVFLLKKDLKWDCYNIIVAVTLRMVSSIPLSQTWS